MAASLICGAAFVKALAQEAMMFQWDSSLEQLHEQFHDCCNNSKGNLLGRTSPSLENVTASVSNVLSEAQIDF